MYGWSNAKILDTLAASGAGDRLIFRAGSEEAHVLLAGRDISRVGFRGSSAEKVIRPDEARHVVVGEGNSCRDVYHFLAPGGPAPTMRLGITKHRGVGTWSSLPHDFELNLEPGFEEVFFHLLEGEAGRRAIQVGRGMWCTGERVDTIWQVKDHHFSTVPMGYHPVVGEPGVHVSYVWVYLAKYPRWEKVK